MCNDIKLTIVHEGMQNCGNSGSDFIRETSSGVRFRKASGNANDTLEVGDIGEVILSNGEHMVSGIYTGLGSNDLDPNSWDINLGY